MTDSVYQSVGGLTLPFTSADIAAGKALQGLDPALDRMLGWFQAAINSELQDAWTTAVAVLPATHPYRNGVVSPVADVLPHAPTLRFLRERKSEWPLLCLHRGDDFETEPALMDHERVTQEWFVHYIMGPMDLAGMQRFGRMSVGLRAILLATIRDQGHKAYEDGANQVELCGFESLRLKGGTGPREAGFDGDENMPTYFAMRYTLETTEITSDIITQLPDFEGVDLYLDVGGAGSDEINPDFIVARSDVPL